MPTRSGSEPVSARKPLKADPDADSDFDAEKMRRWPRAVKNILFSSINGFIYFSNFGTIGFE